jgi:hypothetical protein
MLTFQTHPQEVQEMQNIINSGKFFSVTFIKMDNSIRYVNGRKILYQSDSPETENRGKFNRFDKNILLVWDNNRINDVTGEKGQYISVKLERLLFFKSGAFSRDYTEENSDVLHSAQITPEQIEQIKNKIKIGTVIQEEAENLFETEPNNMKNQKLLQLLKIIQKYSLAVIVMKAMILNGIDSEESLIEFLKTDATLPQPTKVNLQNAYRDITRNHLYNINEIPVIFK